MIFYIFVFHYFNDEFERKKVLKFKKKIINGLFKT